MIIAYPRSSAVEVDSSSRTFSQKVVGEAEGKKSQGAEGGSGRCSGEDVRFVAQGDLYVVETWTPGLTNLGGSRPVFASAWTASVTWRSQPAGGGDALVARLLEVLGLPKRRNRAALDPECGIDHRLLEFIWRMGVSRGGRPRVALRAGTPRRLTLAGA